MSYSRLSVHDLKQAVDLLKERESLQAQIEKIDTQLRRIESGGTLVSERPLKAPVAPKTKRQGKKGKRQKVILKALEAAGQKGVSVLDLAAQTKINPNSLRVWLYTAGKKIAGLKKISRGVFALRSSGA